MLVCPNADITEIKQLVEPAQFFCFMVSVDAMQIIFLRLQMFH